MKNSRKGFTLVELLVVIAILAILATVVVVGYTGCIEKANISNDTAIASELNLLLKAESVTNKIDSFDEVVDVLYANGFYLANLNTKTEGCFFVWDSVSNQILFVSAKDGFKVIFPEDGYAPMGETWHLACSDKALIEGLDLGKVKVMPTVSDAKGIASFVKSFKSSTEATEMKLYIDNNTALTSGISFGNKDVPLSLTIELGQNNISAVDEGEDYTPIYAYYGSEINVNGGIITANLDNTLDTATGGTNISTQIKIAFGAKGTINGTTCIANSKEGGHAILVHQSEAEINNVTIKASCVSDPKKGHGIMSQGGSTVTVNDCVIEATGNALFCSNSYGGASKMTVNGGTYTGNTAAIFSQGSTVTVNGGTFIGDLVVYGGSITINGGTFSVNPAEVAGVTVNGTVVDNGNGTWTVQ